MSGEAAKGWHSEIFKRLYRLGFNGRFVGVTWHGAVGTANYHESVYNAFVTSASLKNSLDGYISDASSTTIAAHSLGNMVVSNAIAEENLSLTRYYMINAATPIEAYDKSQVNGRCKNTSTSQLMRNCMREDDWRGYPEETMASEWYRLFGEDDPRRAITWAGRFDLALNYAYNFYSTGEDVVENATESEEVLNSIWNNGLSRHAWVNQEIGKGCQNILFGALNRPCSAGWRFNTHDQSIIGKSIGGGQNRRYVKLTAEEATAARQLPVTDPDHLSDEELAQYGFFDHFDYEDLYAPITPGNDLKTNGPNRADVEALLNNKSVYWDLLAHAIPARSFAVAANPLDDLEERNFNMHDLRDKDSSKNPYWPLERTSNPDLGTNWFHSDFRNMAMPYVYQMYEKMLDPDEMREVQ